MNGKYKYLFIVYFSCFCFTNCEHTKSDDRISSYVSKNELKIETGINLEKKRYFKLLRKMKSVSIFDITDPLNNGDMWFISTNSNSTEPSPILLIYGEAPEGYKENKSVPLVYGQIYRINLFAEGYGRSNRTYYFRHEKKTVVISNLDNPPPEIMGKL